MKALRQPGSALLTVLLMMMAVGAIILLATKNSVSATRGLAQLDNAQVAHERAMSGIDEGLLLLQSNGGTPPQPLGTLSNAKALYGAAASVFNPAPMRRVFSQDAAGACVPSAPAVAGTTFPSNKEGCGSQAYDLAIRSYVRLTSGGAGNVSRYFMTDREIPYQASGASTPVLTLDIPTSGALFTLAIADSTSTQVVHVRQLDSAGAVVSESDLTSTTPVSVAPSTAGLTLFKTATDSSTSKNLISFTLNTGSIVIQRASTLIVSTGYAYGTQRQAMLSVPRFNPATAPKTLVDFTGSFDSNGLIQ